MATAKEQYEQQEAVEKFTAVITAIRDESTQETSFKVGRKTFVLPSIEIPYKLVKQLSTDGSMIAEIFTNLWAYVLEQNPEIDSALEELSWKKVDEIQAEWFEPLTTAAEEAVKEKEKSSTAKK